MAQLNVQRDLGPHGHHESVWAELEEVTHARPRPNLELVTRAFFQRDWWVAEAEGRFGTLTFRRCRGSLPGRKLAFLTKQTCYDVKSMTIRYVIYQ
jgi:hypothetical protein